MSVQHALHGLQVVAAEPNARIHLTATALVLPLGACCGLSRAEWCAIVLAIGAVWIAEGLNTAIERLADAAVPQRHPLVRAAKDSAAAAVFLAAICSVVVAALVFAPHLIG
jgi:diacylglycerol kinase